LGCYLIGSGVRSGFWRAGGLAEFESGMDLVSVVAIKEEVPLNASSATYPDPKHAHLAVLRCRCALLSTRVGQASGRRGGGIMY